MRSGVDFANKGGHVLGVCNGVQGLIEAGLFPGALRRNSGLKYVCKDAEIKVETTSSAFTNMYTKGETVTYPIAHHDGNYVAEDALVAQLRDEDRIAFTYADNPNGSTADIAGVLSQNRRVLGMMPHPERLNDAQLGGTDGNKMFTSLTEALVSA